jgi:glycosyltransferase involved in cell wall biosynthesis
MRILFITYEPWPTHRPDVIVLFGKYLRRLGITSDLVAEAEQCGQPPATAWDGGAVISCTRPAGRARQHLSKLWINVKSVFGADRNVYDCIQVRDMSMSALAGLLAARLKGIRFVYWLSYLQSEGHIARARARGPRAGLKYWYPLIEGMIGRFIVYKLVLPRADHVFVQSDAMKKRLASLGVPAEKMTPVPMCVDLEDAGSMPDAPPAIPALAGRRPVAYLGLMNQDRQVDVLLHMLVRVKAVVPDVILIMAGDTPDEAHREWLKAEASRLGLEKDIVWTGWVVRDEAWNYVRAAEIALSPIPRGDVLDTSSPTKAVEYMALGVPVVCNDNPDQKLVIDASSAGICVRLDAAEFADAVVSLLQDETRRLEMGRRGPGYVRAHRSYARLAQDVASVYEKVCGVALADMRAAVPVTTDNTPAASLAEH